MSIPYTIALDAMGGDNGPNAVIPGAALILKERPDLRFLLVGDETKIQPILADYPEVARASEILHTDKVISGDEKPSIALRNGRDSSMRLAINAVQEGRAAAVVSSGNTGALMATAKMVLKCLPGIHRPAIASLMPSQKNRVVMLDMGANVHCDAEMLVQFAIMGVVYAREIFEVKEPTIGILNVGSEDMKGHEEVQAAAAMLRNLQIPGKFHGFIEGNDITLGTVNVVVTDGFTGNIALKTAEGVGKMAVAFLKEAIKSSALAMIGAFLAGPALRKMAKRIDPRLYNGGMLLGLDGICIKSHGGTDALGFSTAIRNADDLARKGYNKRVATAIDQILKQPESSADHPSPPSQLDPAA
jgi:glycerol-3-phosphate acyltransferase PlsX